MTPSPHSYAVDVATLFAHELLGLDGVPHDDCVSFREALDAIGVIISHFNHAPEDLVKKKRVMEFNAN
jgi:hypothetical protein